MTSYMGNGDPPKSKLDHYRRKFGRPAESMFEGMSNDDSNLVFNESQVKEQLGYSKEGLYLFIENYLDNDAELKKLADHVIEKGEDPLRAVANNDHDFIENSEDSSFLEVLVKTDGSRPSFLVRNGDVDIQSSPIGEWKNTLEDSGANLKKAIDCVGRVNIDNRHVGTGFLIHRNLIITNRHVLQGIATQTADGHWDFKPGAHIDFGYEFKARVSINPRSLKKLVYCGARKIESPVDHTKLDLALIEIEEVPDDMVPQHILSWDESSTWAWEGTNLYTIGYPGPPNTQVLLKDSEKIFDLIFKRTYGCKRLAPGKVLSGPKNNLELKLNHDATTLGGNSGSVIVVSSSENVASGLHYGGDLEDPRENWGHLFGNVLNMKNTDNKTLRECLDAYKIQIVRSDG